MKRIVLIAFFVLGSITLISAQDYNTGIGVRGGFANGITLKHFVSNKTAFEGIIASRWKGFELTGLIEFHARAFATERLNWYAGFGAHAGFWNGDNVKWGTPGVDYSVFGLDGILGMEYNFAAVPFNISIDWKPAYNLWGYSGFWADGGALSVRYIF
jgi:hypothetical protein